jgi:hypothetical protein
MIYSARTPASLLTNADPTRLNLAAGARFSGISKRTSELHMKSQAAVVAAVLVLATQASVADKKYGTGTSDTQIRDNRGACPRWIASHL